MAFWKRKVGRENRVRIFYATDVHGSERTFRKFINCAKVYGVDHLVMGGDIMGKFLIPIVDEGGGRFRVTLQDELYHLEGEDAVQDIRNRVETLGFYHVTVPEDELHAMQNDQDHIDETFKREAHARLERWITLAEERLAGTGVKWYVTGGNDDPQDLMDVLHNAQSEHVISCEDRVIMLEDVYPMANCGWSNPTPWNTPRETDEATLEAMLEKAIEDVGDFSSAIFNMHVPPYDSTLDECPKLDWSTDPTPVVAGGVQLTAPAGSTAVRNVIESISRSCT